MFHRYILVEILFYSSNWQYCSVAMQQFSYSFRCCKQDLVNQIKVTDYVSWSIYCFSLLSQVVNTVTTALQMILIQVLSHTFIRYRGLMICPMYLLYCCSSECYLITVVLATPVFVCMWKWLFCPLLSLFQKHSQCISMLVASHRLSTRILKSLWPSFILNKKFG